MTSNADAAGIVRHLNPPCQSDDAVEVAADLAPYGMPGRKEMLWVVPVRERGYVVACIPFFSYSIQFGDLVAIDLPTRTFLHVLIACGLRTMRIAFADESHAHSRHEVLRSQLQKSRLPHEWLDACYVSILLRDCEEQELVLGIFRDDIEARQVEWEVDPQW